MSIISFGWLIVAVLLARGFFLGARDWLRSKRCKPHGVFGRCLKCEADAASRERAVAAERAETERQQLDVLNTYENMSEGLRSELTTLVMKRVKDEHLIVGLGDLETAVVRLYRRRQKIDS